MIEENNKLIAEFMGFRTGMTWLEDGEYETTHSQQKWVESVLFCGWDNVKEFTPEEMLFHSSWNWLMPVVEKIGKIEFINTKPLAYLMVVNTAITAPIETLYERVVEFIKWYNVNNNKPI